MNGGSEDVQQGGLDDPEKKIWVHGIFHPAAKIRPSPSLLWFLWELVTPCDLEIECTHAVEVSDHQPTCTSVIYCVHFTL